MSDTAGAIRPWLPPTDPPTDPARIPAMNGARLFDAGRYREETNEVLGFLADVRPACLEVGFDHGMCLVDRARANPGTLQLGLEIREARVRALKPHLPLNAFAWRADARAALAAVLPPSRFDQILVLFPDPVWKADSPGRRARRLLFSPAFVALCARALVPGGALHLSTDVDGYFRWVEGLLAAWTRGRPPPSGGTLSRRERVCRRDGVQIHRGTWLAPSST